MVSMSPAGGVVRGALRRIAEGLVRFLQLLKRLGCSRVIALLIRVMLQRLLAIRKLDLLLARISVDTKYVVVILIRPESLASTRIR